MSKTDLLLKLEEPLKRLSCGVNAVELMVYGLESVKDPYADGLFAAWNYLRAAELEVHEIVTAVSAESRQEKTAAG